MSAEVFVDTNIVVYAVDTTEAAAHKREIARKILLKGGFCLSTQVLQEFFVTATKKLKRPLTVATAARWVDQMCRANFVVVDASLIKLAIAHSARHRISYRDGAIIAAAEAGGASTIYSQDLSHGQSYGPVRVINPFVAG